MHRFTAKLGIIGVNPFVFVPAGILEDIFSKAGRSKGPVPVKGSVNGKPYTQTLVRFKGHWRLYINMKMLTKSPSRIGEILDIEIDHDPADRNKLPHQGFMEALGENTLAREVYNNLSPSRQREINRYISSLKSRESIQRNIERAIGFLAGKNSFAGREKP
ncbi:MAG: YdeI/OmpD-associated family protein [Bacteroidales bacterium]